MIFTTSRAVMEFDIASKTYERSEWIPLTAFHNPQGAKYVNKVVLFEHKNREEEKSICS